MLEHDGIACDQRRQHGIDRCQIRKIPGCDDRDDAERHALDLARKAGLGTDIDRGEGLGRDPQQEARAFLEAAHLARSMADRSAHLPADLDGNLLGVGNEGVDGLAEQRAARRERNGMPGSLRVARRRQRAVDRRVRGERPFHEHAPVHGTDGLEGVLHGVLEWSGRSQMISK